jgi:glycine hydroxymethyltransferase
MSMWENAMTQQAGSDLGADGIRARLKVRPWVPSASEALVQSVADATAKVAPGAAADRLEELAASNRHRYEHRFINLNPATNTMNPRAEALLASGLGTRPSLGYPGAKYETGLEDIEQIEIMAAELAAEVFDADYVEIRVPSGAMANLYAFMACTRPGDAVIVPPASIAGHVTHHGAGAAGLYGLVIHEAPVDAIRYTVDIDRLGDLARQVRPAAITVGGSLNLSIHDVAGVRAVADEVGASVIFDAAHLSGLIAGRVWPNPLADGADVMTMSTYKSLGGPPSGLLATNDPGLAERLDAIAFPGMTANFDVAKSAALALTLLDWIEFGSDYAEMMVRAARRLAERLHAAGADVVRCGDDFTHSHALALDVADQGGGTGCARRLAQAGLLASAIGLPSGGDAGLRLGVNEMVRLGASLDQVDEVAELVDRALPASTSDLEQLASEVADLRARFRGLSYCRVD